jgi:hypothetical protein
VDFPYIYCLLDWPMMWIGLTNFLSINLSPRRFFSFLGFLEQQAYLSASVTTFYLENSSLLFLIVCKRSGLFFILFLMLDGTDKRKGTEGICTVFSLLS